MDVEFVTLKKYKTPKFSDEDISVIRDSVRQFELYSQLAKPLHDPMYQELLRDFYPKEQAGNRIIIRSVTDPYMAICDYEKMIERTYLGKWEDTDE